MDGQFLVRDAKLRRVESASLDHAIKDRVAESGRCWPLHSPTALGRP